MFLRGWIILRIYAIQCIGCNNWTVSWKAGITLIAWLLVVLKSSIILTVLIAAVCAYFLTSNDACYCRHIY